MIRCSSCSRAKRALNQIIQIKEIVCIVFLFFLFPNFTTLTHEPSMSNQFRRIDYKHFLHILFWMLQNTSTITDAYAR